MEILQVPKARKLADAYNDGQITLSEFMEKLEQCWDMKIYRRTKAPSVERTSGPMTSFLSEIGRAQHGDRDLREP
jgi:hypothetical protein